MLLLGAAEFETTSVDPERILQGFSNNGLRVNIVTHDEFKRMAHTQMGIEVENESTGTIGNLYLSTSSSFFTIDTTEENKLVVELSGDKTIMRIRLRICYASGGKILRRIHFGRRVFLYERVEAVNRCITGESDELSGVSITNDVPMEIRVGRMVCLLYVGRCISRFDASERWFVCLDWRRDFFHWHDHHSVALVEKRLRQGCIGELSI